jgi:regulatory protein
MNETQTLQNSDLKAIKDYCLSLLVRREHSQKELLNKSLLKGWGTDDIVTVIDELAVQAWQSDSRYAESFTRHRINKGYGPLWISYELRKNGIDGFNVGDVAQQTVGSWMDLLEQVYSKKYKQASVLDRNEWAKRSRFLMQRGFSSTMISSLFDHLNIKL